MVKVVKGRKARTSRSLICPRGSGYSSVPVRRNSARISPAGDVPEKRKDESFVNDTSNLHRLIGRGKTPSNRGGRNESSSEAEPTKIGITSKRRENRPSSRRRSPVNSPAWKSPVACRVQLAFSCSQGKRVRSTRVPVKKTSK